MIVMSHTQQYGATVNVLDLWQYTPLHEAASKSRSDVCTLLLLHGADPTINNCHGRTVLDLCLSEELRKKIECKSKRKN